MKVRILDAQGNLTSSTASVTLTKHAGSPAGILTGGGAVNAVDGVATFSGLSIDQAGTGLSLDAASPGLTACDERRLRRPRRAGALLLER